MTDKGWKSKGDKEPRRSPRKRGKTCGRPFKAPRPVSEAVERDSDVVLLTTDTDSQVQVITETENERDLRSKRRSVMLSEREVNEMCKYGEVIIIVVLTISKKSDKIHHNRQHLNQTRLAAHQIFFNPLVLRLFRQ